MTRSTQGPLDPLTNGKSSDVSDHNNTQKLVLSKIDFTYVPEIRVKDIKMKEK